ncbi:MAG: SET domain-containing protein-lysine N-methyltransferase [Bacteroidetes bacterium]|nr:SET domain-containing protein-lysine N-methyltransferase [Bacteroidota bacterium]
MIHPDTDVRHVSEQIGYGVFANKLIPKGTIVYAKDSLEIEVADAEYSKHSVAMQEVIEKFSYIDERGIRILSWDFAKYVNHNCNRNTISTGYGFEIAIRDIQAGEEVTDEYGIFNLGDEFQCGCGAANCRGTIKPNDLDTYYQKWDEEIKDALKLLFQVNQPLMHLVEEKTRKELDAFFVDATKFPSIRNLRYQKKSKDQVKEKVLARK